MFGTYKCSRLAYALILVAVFAFEYAKTPLEQFLDRLYNQAMKVAVPDTKNMSPEEFAAVGGVVTKQNEILVFSEGKLMKYSPGSKPGHHHGTSRQKPSFETIMSTEEFIKKTSARSTMRQTISGGHLAVMWVIGIANLLFITWAVFARIRDIGWSHYVGVGILGAFILKQMMLSDFPPVALYGLQYFFLIGLVGLALIPRNFPNRAQPLVTANAPLSRLPTNTPRALFGQGNQRNRNR